MEATITMYFKGGTGIKNPKDFNGVEIKEGDTLTHDWFENDYVAFFKRHAKLFDLDEIERRVHEPSVIVKYNKEKEFFYGEGIKDKSYMHDFRFKFCKIVPKDNQTNNNQ
jgi:hypothetical protein